MFYLMMYSIYGYMALGSIQIWGGGGGEEWKDCWNSLLGII